ncbi:MAG: major facilitator superfamily 1 [Cyanobacteria bacterium RYN_339]|nr:major facilitator superfamily 1 [Cyanobacteria bacterium RYN_339]
MWAKISLTKQAALMQPLSSPFASPDYVRYLVGSTCLNLGQTMLGAALGWEIYERTHDALALGYVGLTEIIPVVLFALAAGQVADKYERRHVVMLALAGMIAAVLTLAWLSLTGGPIWAFYACIFVTGTSQAFYGTARSAMLPRTVPGELLERAVTISSSVSQGAYLIGPAIAGLVIGRLHLAGPIYFVEAVAAGIFLVLLAGMQPMPVAPSGKAAGWGEVFAGARFVWNSELMLASITMDMFAVLLGGAVTLLPIFAKDVLHAGPEGLGWLLMASPLGAFITGVWMSRRAPIRRNGPVLLWVVVGFGFATIGFGLSTNIWLSWAMLCLAGGFDMVSMVIRLNMLQKLTPDAMRGRVNAVHSVFIGTSNELGGFESGLTAKFWGPLRSVVFGGVGTLVTVGLTAWKYPSLRRMGAIPDAE